MRIRLGNLDKYKPAVLPLRVCSCISLKKYLVNNVDINYWMFQSEWFGSCVFEHLHPEDVEKVREQLSTQEPQNAGRILDLKTGTVKKEGHQCE